jgi:hypothetical protein
MEEILPAFTAGIVSTIICNPLDVVRVNYQLGIKQKINFSIFYKGLSYGLLTIPTFWVIYFPTYKKSKEYIYSPFASYISCCLSSSITAPLWLFRQNKQTGKPVIFNKPIHEYYKGLLATFMINLNFIVQIPTYEFLKTKFENNTLNIFLITSFSKTLSTTIFYPLDTIRAKIRNGEKLKNLTITNLYKGIYIYLFRSIPYHCSIFCTYEYIKNIK